MGLRSSIRGQQCKITTIIEYNSYPNCQRQHRCFFPPIMGGKPKKNSPPWSRIMGGKGNVPPHGLERWGGNAFPPHKMGGRIFHSPPSYAISPPSHGGESHSPPILWGGNPQKWSFPPHHGGEIPKIFACGAIFPPPHLVGKAIHISPP